MLAEFTFWRGVFVLLVLAALYATWVRFAQGLGAATNLSDRFPWGLWIGFDVLVGVGLAAGGFVTAATVHLFKIEKYEPIARPALLTAFLGYLLVIVALLFDLGRPYRIWHPLVMWNPHSVMFEVAWCVMLYTTVLALEFSPMLLERLGLTKALRIVHAIFIPLVITGVLLSTMHQSSLGTLYVIAPDKLHGLWYSPFLPVFFFISAIAGGLAMTILESFLSYRAFGKRLEEELLQGLGRVIVVVLGVYAVWRTEDLSARGNLHLLFTITPESVLFWGEAVLGVLLPMALFAIPKVRRNPHLLFLAAVLTIMGFVINRLNVAITGMEGWSEAGYFPSWMELAVTIGIVAAGFALFRLAVQHLKVFPEEEEGTVAARTPAVVAWEMWQARRRPAFHGGVLVLLWVLLLAGAVSVGYTMKRQNGRHVPPPDTSGTAIRAASAAGAFTLPPEYPFPAGPGSPGTVVFRHESHVDPANADCGVCHRSLFRLNEAGTPVGGTMSMDRAHTELCGSCHDGQKAFDVDDGCDVCHSS
jgi:c(7)-type cytochrome triheme protein